MTPPRPLLRPLLLAVVVASFVALAAPAYREVLDEPSPEEDLFYWADYHKRQTYRTRVEFAWGWGWAAGLAVGISTGFAHHVVAKRRKWSGGV